MVLYSPADFMTHSRLIAIALAAAVFGCSRTATPADTPLVEVSIETVESATLPLSLQYSGHTAGSREVEVRARVSGILLARKFEEGRPVKAGQVLFEIDPEPARAVLAQAEAELAMQRAQAAQAKRESERILAMAEQGLVSNLQRDQTTATAEIAAANELAARARLRKAQLDLSYCEVRAPIDGLASNEARSEGSLVTAGTDSSLLTRIVQADPLYVEFRVPDTDAATLRAAALKQKLLARIELADGSEYHYPAVLGFLDNTVDAASGSIAARATVRNPDRALLPGQFVRVRVDGVKLENVIGVPRRAVLNNDTGHFVWTLDAHNTAVIKPITLGATVGDRVIVKRGLEVGERIVVEGAVKVAAGQRVNVVISALAATPSARQASLDKNSVRD